MPELEMDPFGFFGEEEESNTPAPPDLLDPLEPDQTDPEAQIMPTTTMGVNLETYFLQDIDDPNTRIKRLENVIMAMHKDLQALTGTRPPTKYNDFAPDMRNYNPPVVSNSPTLTNPQNQQGGMLQPGTPQPLTKAERALAAPGQISPVQDYGQAPIPITPQIAVSQPMAHFPNAQPVGAPPSPSAVPVQAAPPPTQAPAATASPSTGQSINKGPWHATTASSNDSFATGIRVGEHSSKVRVVFDVTRKVTFRADLDNNEKFLVVELPETGWKAPPSAKFPKMAVMDSYRVDPYNGQTGSIAVIQLDKATHILKTQQIKALSGSGYRIYIDLAK